MFFFGGIRTKQCFMLHQLLTLGLWSESKQKAIKDYEWFSWVASRRIKSLCKAAKTPFFECLKCKFKLTNDLYNQLVAFFFFANCLNTIFRSLSSQSKSANIATSEKYSIHSVLQSAAHLSALCLLTWKINGCCSFALILSQPSNTPCNYLTSFCRKKFPFGEINRNAIFPTNDFNEAFHTRELIRDINTSCKTLVWSFNDHKIEDYRATKESCGKN